MHDQPDIDLRGGSVSGARSCLESVAADLRGLWAAAIERSDFTEVARLVEASHAVHRAVIALGAEPVIAGRSRAGPTEEKHVLPAAALTPPP
jgi:hypothetical protein